MSLKLNQFITFSMLMGSLALSSRAVGQSASRFCSDLDRSLALVKSEKQVKASDLLDQMRRGQTTPYIKSIQQVSSAGSSDKQQGQQLWVSVSGMILESMGKQARNPILIDQVNDLRYISQTVPKSQVLLIANQKEDLTPERAKAVAEAASGLGVQVNILWIPANQSEQMNGVAKDLARIAKATEGAFLELSNKTSCR